MSLYPSARARQRIIDQYTPPPSIDDPVRESRVPASGCKACGQKGLKHQLGRPCVCGGTMEALPASAWRWCRACGGRGACCSACGWHGVELASLSVRLAQAMIAP